MSLNVFVRRGAVSGAVRNGLMISALSTAAVYANGQLDTTFRPVLPLNVSDPVRAVSILPDGWIIVGGSFGGVNNVPIQGIAQLNPSGQLNANFNLMPNGAVLATAPLRDGRMYIGGQFQVIGGAQKNRLARMTATGSIDAGFTSANPHPNPVVAAIAPLQVGGALVIGGPFGMAKLQQNGTLFPEFTRYIDSGQNLGVTNLSLKQTGGVVMSGAFALRTNEVDESFIETLLVDGKKDTAFTANVSGGAVMAHAIQADGSIVIGGQFATLAGTARPFLARITASGSRDPGFTPTLNSTVQAVVVQTDGKILIGGDFTTVNGKTRRGIARLLPDGELDETFDAKLHPANYAVRGISLQADGKIIINGNFSGTETTNQARLARLNNHWIHEEVRATSANRVQWLRQGSLPEAEAVEFEINTGGSWQSLGFGVRMEGGWEWTGPTLPAAAQIRAIARVKSGANGGSSSLLVSAPAIYPRPATTVTNETGEVIPDGGGVNFGQAATGASVDVTFLVRNTGTGNLAQFATNITGADAALFQVITEPEAPVAGPDGSTPMVVRFAPTTVGEKAATLTLSSDDLANPQYVIQIGGIGEEPQDPKVAWRIQYFGTGENEGDAADDADPDGDGYDNHFEYVAGLDPTDAASRFDITMGGNGGNATVRYGPCLEGRTYVVEASSTLEAGSWTPAPGSTADDGEHRIFTADGAMTGKRFFRVTITRP